jgi:type I restriction enzyme, S subunit
MDKMPKNWRSSIVDDVAIKIHYGYTGKTIENGQYKYLRITDIQNSAVKWEQVPFVSIADKDVEKYLLNENDIVFARTGATAGKSFLINTLKANSVFASYLIRIIPDLDKIHPRFLYIYFQSPEYWRYITSNVEGAAQPNFNGKKLAKIPIPLPPLSEQKRIVSKLDALFERIEKSIALLEENIKHTESLMASALDEIFKKLESKSKVYKISDFADIKGGKRLPKGLKVQEEKTDYPYIRVADFQDNGTVDLSSLQYITKKAHEQIKRYIINPEDLYISIAGTIGKTGIIPEELKGANLTENAARFVFKSDFEINNKFIYYFTLSDNFKTQITDATKTVAQPKLALTRLKAVELPIPDIVLQNKAVKSFDSLYTNTYEIIQEQQDKLNNLKALKESILDKAFKGEI